MNDRVSQIAGAGVASAVVAALVTAGVMWWVMGAGGPPGGEGAGGPGGFGGPPGGGPPPASVVAADATVQTLRQRMGVPGRLREVRSATVAAQVTGSVLEVPVREGDPVVGGETVLAKIDPVWTRLDLKQAEADLAEEQALLEQTKRELVRVDRLRAQSAATQEEVDDRKTAVDAAQARVDALRATRDRAQQSVDRLNVIAPFDGHVTRKLVEVGQWVTPGAAVVDLISSGDIDAELDVPERVVNRLNVGDEVEVFVESLGRSVMGNVSSITPAGPSAARTYPVKIRLDDQGGVLKSGMSVTARLPLGPEAEQLTVPRDAVRLTAGGEGQGTVWAAIPPETAGANPSAPPAEAAPPMPTAAPLRVRVLFSEGPSLAVDPLPSEGGKRLEAGMSVVVQGAEGLFPGRNLILVDQIAAAPDAPDTANSPEPAPATQPDLDPATLRSPREKIANTDDGGTANP